MYPQGVCRIRKPACAGNGCAIFPTLIPHSWGKRSAAQPKTICSEIPKYARIVTEPGGKNKGYLQLFRRVIAFSARPSIGTGGIGRLESVILPGE